jgi:hypothetical protein
MSDSRQLVRELLQSITETVDTLLALDDAHLDAACSHGCAMNGGIRRLLVHNAEHDRMHAGAISTARYEGKAMQESELARFVRDLLRERVELVGQLLNAPDDVLALQGKGDEWDVRKHVKHVLYAERDSMATVRAEQGIGE